MAQQKNSAQQPPLPRKHQLFWLSEQQTHEAGVVMKSDKHQLKRAGTEPKEWNERLYGYLCKENQQFIRYKFAHTQQNTHPTYWMDHYLAEPIELIRADCHWINNNAQLQRAPFNADLLNIGRKFALSMRKNAVIRGKNADWNKIERQASKPFVNYEYLPQMDIINKYRHFHKNPSTMKVSTEFLNMKKPDKLPIVPLSHSEWCNLSVKQNTSGYLWFSEEYLCVIMELPMGKSNKHAKSIQCDNYKDGSLQEKCSLPKYIYNDSETDIKADTANTNTMHQQFTQLKTTLV